MNSSTGARADFFEGTLSPWEDQEARTLATKQEEIIYYGLVLFGPHEIVSELTGKLSLYRGAAND